MSLTLTGELINAAVLLPRTAADDPALLIQVRDPASKEIVKLICPDEPWIRKAFQQSRKPDGAGSAGMVTLRLKPKMVSVTGLTNGKVVGNLYQLHVIGIEGSEATRSQPTGEGQGAKRTSEDGKEVPSIEYRRRPR